MNKSIFEFQNYKAYVNSLLQEKPHKGRGFRGKMAEAMRSQPAFVSQVLQGEAHFNLEHGDALNTLLGHNEQEAHFFMLLIQYARAGNEKVKKYFQKQMQKVLDERLVLKNRLKTEKTLSLEDQAIYYSAWYYAAVRIVTAIPGQQTKEAISKRLNLPMKKTNEVLDFLTSHGLLEQDGNIYKNTMMYMHLGNDSPLIAKHHTNWRIRAIDSLEKETTKDMHYSVVACLTQEDAMKIKAKLVQYLEEIQKIIRPSKEETLYTFCLDFFEI